MSRVRHTLVLAAGAGLVAGTGVLLPAAAAPAPTTSAAVTSSAVAYKTKFFHTPSGNIGCGIIKAQGRWSIRCDVKEHDWMAPSGKTCTEGDYGSSLGMGGKARPRFICVSDALNNGKTLTYGKSLSYGPFYCKSKVKGLKCWNKRAHGWFLSRQTYRLF